MVPRRSHPLRFYSSLGVSSFKCVFGGNFIFIFFSLSSKASQEFCILKQVPLGTKSLDTFALPSFAAPVPSLLQRLLGCFSFGFTCRERIYVYVPVGKLINTYTRAPKAWFSSLPDTATCSGADGHQEHYSHSFDPGFEQGEGEWRTV